MHLEQNVPHQATVVLNQSMFVRTSMDVIKQATEVVPQASAPVARQALIEKLRKFRAEELKEIEHMTLPWQSTDWRVSRRPRMWYHKSRSPWTFYWLNKIKHEFNI
ncbi:hypothetical protein V6N13_091890 [Hibiscus sabdariffa]|uniref:Uncharacterized protein n=1 Tax=Hibiscus sabdariffa TaxID=183260 RepID=A0ABR2QFS4_9ROSI